MLFGALLLLVLSGGGSSGGGSWEGMPFDQLPDLPGLDTSSGTTSPDGSPAATSDDDRPDDLEALDAAWEAEAVTFGPPPAPGDCPNAAAMLRRMNAPAEPVQAASDRRAD